MRKSLLFTAAFLFSLMLAAQVSPMERALTKGMVKVTDDIGDFTITDSDGNTWNLYDELSLQEASTPDRGFQEAGLTLLLRA